MTYQRYSVDKEPASWFPVGERNQFKLVLRDCWMGKAGEVVKENWTAGVGHSFTVVGSGRWIDATPGGPAWGDSSTYVHTLEADV